MKKYRVWASNTDSYQILVLANSKDEAWERANSVKPREWVKVVGNEWLIEYDTIQEVEPKKGV